jgi:DNA primase
VSGRIKAEDIDLVRERARIEEVVRETVTLKAAGGGSYKGLCPFHDERTPSFHVTSAKNLFHCFSCGEGGDVITFVRKVDALSFTEAVEKLAAKYNIVLRYEESNGKSGAASGQGVRTRLVEAHKLAATFYRTQLDSPAAEHARDFLLKRGFDKAAIDHFGVGYSPSGWDGLTNYLKGHGFSIEELITAGLAVASSRGGYDRFRDRVMWPIRDSGGDVIGFGARKLSESDEGPKYLNTPETPIYRKSTVLYGIDLARKAIAKASQAVIVEGYTDVMACHLAGITTAVATCGTAFGGDHVKVLRRILADQEQMKGEVIFTFDGDAAGRKAALKAYNEDQKFVANTSVAVDPNGMDPCDIRQQFGDAAVQALIESRVPLFEFVLRSIVDDHNLTTAEGRVSAMRAVAPVLQGIKDPALRPEYIRVVAGWLAIDEGSLRSEVNNTKRTSAPTDITTSRLHGVTSTKATNVEREALKCVLQHPDLVGQWFGALEETLFTNPTAAAIFGLCLTAGDPVEASSQSMWVTAVLDAAPTPEIAAKVRELTIEPLPNDNPDERYVHAILARLLELDAARRIAEIKASLQRFTDQSDPDGQQQLLADLIALENYRREMRDFAIGDRE